MATHSSIIGKFHGQRSLAGYSSLGHRVGYDLATEYVCTDNTHLLPDIFSSFFLSNIRSSSGFENRYITFIFFLLCRKWADRNSAYIIVSQSSTVS